MDKEFPKLIEYLNYLINDAQIDLEQKERLKKLESIITGLKELNDVKNKAYAHDKFKDANERLETLLKKYLQQKNALEQQLSSQLFDYGSDKLTFLNNSIDTINDLISNNYQILDEIIDRKLGCIKSNKHELLSQCFETLVLKGSYFNYFEKTLIRLDKTTNNFIINEVNVERIYQILNDKEEFTKLEQATRLYYQINKSKEEKEKLDLAIEYYDLIVSWTNLSKDIYVLRDMLRHIDRDYETELQQLIAQKNSYCNIPCGRIIFKNNINHLLKKIKSCQKQKKYSDLLFVKLMDRELKRDDIEAVLRHNNLHFLFNGTEKDWYLDSKNTLMAKQQSLNSQIQESNNILRDLISQLDEPYKRLYLDDKVTCRNLIFGLKDEPSIFISFYILLMFVSIEHLVNNNPKECQTTKQIVNSIAEEYFSTQHKQIVSISGKHQKIFSLKKN